MNLKTILAIGVTALFLVPAASANHGQTIAYVAQLSDGSAFVALGLYDSGDGNFQTWLFEVLVDGADNFCTGFGSIEAGFQFVDCPGGVGGTGRFQPYLSVPPVDSGQVSASWASATGTATFVEVG